MLRVPSLPPYGEHELDAWRQICDPLADAVIADLEKTRSIKNPVDMLAVVRERAAMRGGVYRDFLDACDAVPGWVDFERMRAGQRLIGSAGPLMGLDLSREEIDAHFHLWRYAGHVLGIRPELLPETLEDEVRQFLPMLRHQADPDEGPPEARTILDEIADEVPLLPSVVSRRFFHQVTAYLVGEELVRGLGIELDPRDLGLKLLRTAGRTWSVTHKRLPGGEAVLHWLGQRQFDGLLAGARREKARVLGNPGLPSTAVATGCVPQPLRDDADLRLRRELAPRLAVACDRTRAAGAGERRPDSLG